MSRPANVFPVCVCLLALAAPVSATAQARKDVHRDPLPKSAVARLGKANLLNAVPVWAVFFAQGGKTAVTYIWEENRAPDKFPEPQLLLWDAATGRSVGKRPIGTVTPGLVLLVARPQGDLLAAYTKAGAVTLVAAPTGEAVLDVQFAHPQEIRHLRTLVFSDDGTKLTGAFVDLEGPGPRKVWVLTWEAATGKEISRRTVLTKVPTRLALAPNGTTLALVHEEGVTGKEGLVQFLDTRTGRTWLSRKNWPVRATAVQFSPDGRLLAVTGPAEGLGLTGTTQLFEVGSGAAVWGWTSTERGHGAALAFSRDGRTLFVPDGRRVLALDVLTGERHGELVGHAGDVTCLALSPDGRCLLSGSEDGTALVWEVGERLPPPGSPRPLSKQQLETHWAALASQNAGTAYRSIHALLAAPAQTAAWLENQVPPAPAQHQETVAKLLAGLGDRKFSVREEAQAALLKLGEPAVPALERVAQKPPSLEVKRRVEHLLERLRPDAPSSGSLRAGRVVAVLEYLDTPAARHLLKALAAGDRDAHLTADARAALGRLAR